jgi:hypothetical protein
MRLLIFGKEVDDKEIIKFILEAIKTWKPTEIIELVVVPGKRINSQIQKIAQELSLNYTEHATPLTLKHIGVLLIGDNEKVEAKCKQLNIKLLKFGGES